jgi:hypothetical protein
MIAVDAEACPDDAIDGLGGLLVEDILCERNDDKKTENLVGMMKIWSAPVKALRLMKKDKYHLRIHSWISPGGVTVKLDSTPKMVVLILLMKMVTLAALAGIGQCNISMITRDWVS